MQAVTTIGLDSAFQVHGVDAAIPSSTDQYS